MNKKKIIFTLPDITSGGAERVMSFVAKNISREKFDVSIWACGYEKNTKYNVEGVHVVYFNKPRVLKATPNLFLKLRKEKPDVVISSIAHLNTIMGLLSIFFPKIKFIGREANVLSVRKLYSPNKKPPSSHGYLMDFCYKSLDLILCQSNDMYNDMKNNYNIPENKLTIINNPITDNFKLKKTPYHTKKEVINFVTVASLKKQKGHERIIRTLAKLNFPYTYTIIGNGSEKENIFRLINDLNLGAKIKHIPYTNEVSSYLSKNDFFLQGSFVEGFPNSLIESCSVGTPVIAIKAPGGLDEIIEENINGKIAANENDFLNKIIESISQSWDKTVIRESVVRKFNKEKIISEYENLFLEILNKS